jgi:hypothetical protein
MAGKNARRRLGVLSKQSQQFTVLGHGIPDDAAIEAVRALQVVQSVRAVPHRHYQRLVVVPLQERLVEGSIEHIAANKSMRATAASIMADSQSV